MLGAILEGSVYREHGKNSIPSYLPCCVSLKGSVVLHVRTCARALCKVNYRHATCKLRVTFETAATLYGEHSILVQLDLAKHSGSWGERV